MKINFDIKKSTDAASNLLSKAADLGKKAVEETKNNAVALSEKAKEDSYLRKLKKYNPLFPDAYNDASFHYPNIIIIVADSSRNDVDVCQGAVGWRSNDSGTDVLYLHESTAKDGKLNFFPSPVCDAAYYIDTYDETRYIRTDCIFGKAHEERLAELKNVAHLLGAKSCTIEITESVSQNTSASTNAGFSAKLSANKLGIKSSKSSSSSESMNRSGKITAEFSGNDTPKRPKLKWFAQDENIKKLIDMRCKSGNAIKSEVLQLSGSSSATMTQKAAMSIDGAISKIGLGGSVSMESQAVREIHSTLIFSVEF